jgi:hypothetical protein
MNQTKKRYVGYKYESKDQQEPVYEAKGIETVRRDGCPAVVKVSPRSDLGGFAKHSLQKLDSGTIVACSVRNQRREQSESVRPASVFENHAEPSQYSRLHLRQGVPRARRLQAGSCRSRSGNFQVNFCQPVNFGTVNGTGGWLGNCRKLTVDRNRGAARECRTLSFTDRPVFRSSGWSFQPSSC